MDLSIRKRAAPRRCTSLWYRRLRAVLPAIAVALAPLVAHADSQAIPPRTDLTAAQLGHAYGAACYTSQPMRLKKQLPLWINAFWFSPLPNSGHDLGYISPNGAVTVVADSSALSAFCEMTMTHDVGGDGAELYESLEAHLAEKWWRDSAVEADYLDGGVVWSWTRDDVAHTVTYVETEGGFTVTHVAGR